jgi:hypothetical protein
LVESTARVRRERRTDNGLRAVLIAGERELLEQFASLGRPSDSERLRALEAGEPVVLQDWQVPGDLPYAPAWESGIAWYELTASDDLVPVRPITFYGAHKVNGTWLTPKHIVGYEPIANFARSELSEREIGLAELRERVADPDAWRARAPEQRVET